METNKLIKVISTILIILIIIGFLSYHFYKKPKEKAQLPEEQAMEETEIPIFEEEQESPAAAKNVPSSEEETVPEGLFD